MFVHAPYTTSKFTQEIIFLVSLVFFLLATTVNFFGASVNLGIVVIALTSCAFFIFQKFPYRFFLPLVAVIGIILSIGFYSALIETIHWKSNEVVDKFLFLRICVNNVVYVFYSFLVSLVLIEARITLFDLMRLIFLVSVINAIVIIVSFLIPSVHNFIEAILVQDQGSNINYQLIDWRVRGIAAAGGASLSIFMATSVLIGILALENKKLSVSTFLFGTGSILISLILVGRTGLVFGLFIFAAWVVVQFFKGRISRIVLILMSLIAVGILFFLNYSSFKKVIPFAFEMFINFFSGRGVSSASTDALIGMLSIPNNVMGLIFGFGFFEAGVIYRSDSGYIKTLFSLGIFLSFALYMFYAYLLLFVVPKSLTIGRLYWFLGAIFLFFLEIKEPIFYQNYTARLIVLFSIYIFTLRRSSLGKGIN